MNSIKASFVKGIFSLSIGTTIEILFGFFGLMLTVRYVPKEQFGVYILLQVIVNFLLMISDVGISLSTIEK